MAIIWTLLRERVASKALEKCLVIGAMESPDTADMNLALEALDGVLKNLLWYGYAWPKTVSSSTALTTTANVATVTLPTDFYTGAGFRYVDASGNEIGLPIVATEAWREIILKSSKASYPDRVYVDNFNVLWMYPIPNQVITINCYYQAVIADTSANAATALDSPWMLGLVYGVAAEIGDEFDVPNDKLQRWEAKWAMQRNLGIMVEGGPLPDRITVSD